MWPNMQFSSDLVTFAKESLMENLFVSQRARLHFVTLTAQGPWRIYFSYKVKESSSVRTLVKSVGRKILC